MPELRFSSHTRTPIWVMVIFPHTVLVQKVFLLYKLIFFEFLDKNFLLCVNRFYTHYSFLDGQSVSHLSLECWLLFRLYMPYQLFFVSSSVDLLFTYHYWKYITQMLQLMCYNIISTKSLGNEKVRWTKMYTPIHKWQTHHCDFYVSLVTSFPL